MTPNQSSSNYFTHGFHPYPAKFTPQVARKFLSVHCSYGNVVLDPFCGSGTTLVESALSGMDSVGIDINPIACLVSRAKSHKYTVQDIKEIRAFANSMLPIATHSSLANSRNAIVPDLPNHAHWFQDNVSRELSMLKERIDAINGSGVKNLLLCAFSKIIVKVSNQDSEVRYKARQKNHPDGVVFSAFLDVMKNYLDAISKPTHVISGKSEVHRGNATAVLKTLADNHFDFVITSPPYINTFDYYLYHKQRMLWLGFDHHPVRQQEIGNHHRIDAQKPEKSKTDYINSMTHVVSEVARVSKPGSYFVIIIGDGVVKGEIIDMRNIIADICNGTYAVKNVESTKMANNTRYFNRGFAKSNKNEHTFTLQNIK